MPTTKNDYSFKTVKDMTKGQANYYKEIEVTESFGDVISDRLCPLAANIEFSSLAHCTRSA
jgi:hypothetical protein